MAKAKCTVRFERSRAAGGTKIDAVLYARDGRSLNYLSMFGPLKASAARHAKALLMRGCDELSRKVRPPRRVPLGGFHLKDLWPFKKKPAKRHPMSHTVYMMKTRSGSYIPVDRPPNASMAGARRRKRRRR